MADDALLKQLQALAANALGAARKAGAEAADVLVAGGESVEVDVREGALEHLERSDGASLGLRVLIGKRQAVVSVGDPANMDLAEAAERAVAMAKAAPEDPFIGLAEAQAVARDWPDLDLADDFPADAEALAQTLKERALAAEEAALAVKGVAKSVGAGASASRSLVFLAASNGFAGGYARTSFGVSAAVIAGEGGDMQRDYAYDSATHDADLRGPQDIGREAGERAVRRMNPQKPESLSSAPVVFEQRIAGTIAGHLASAINGRSVARGASFLKDSMGQRILPEGVQVIDDARLARGAASRPFDGEGLPTARLAVVENGVLNAWLLDLASARQLGLQGNAHARRSLTAPPSPGPSNFFIDNGTASPEELIKSIRRGVLVTELIGMGVNTVTGDYSRGASGLWIENGEITHAVSEMTIAANLKDMFASLTAANDLRFTGSTNAPTLLIEGMTIAGL